MSTIQAPTHSNLASNGGYQRSLPRRRVLVAQHRLPEDDRDRGSRRVFEAMSALQAGGWNVSFLTMRDSGERHANQLRQRGVCTYADPAAMVDAITASRPDVVLIAFWRNAEKLIPLVREHAPDAKVIIDSVDLHFLREVRRRDHAGGSITTTSQGIDIDEALNREIAAYRAADAIVTVSDTEAEMLQGMLGARFPVRAVPLAETIPPDRVPLDRRQGMIFFGNFRHLPNGEAVEYLLDEVLDHFPREVLAAHPLSIVGHGLDHHLQLVGRHDHVPAARMIGWVPDLLPYVQHARVAFLPLLHGAGVKGKVLQSLAAGTPVVTTTLGAEGTALVPGVHLEVANQACDLAAAAERLLVDDHRWTTQIDQAGQIITRHHHPAIVQRRWLELLNSLHSP